MYCVVGTKFSGIVHLLKRDVTFDTNQKPGEITNSENARFCSVEAKHSCNLYSLESEVLCGGEQISGQCLARKTRCGT